MNYLFDNVGILAIILVIVYSYKKTLDYYE